MIANPAIPHPFTLNDLRMRSAIAEEPSSSSALTLSGVGLAVVLAIGAFVWLDPLHMLKPTEVSAPAPALVPSAAPARSIVSQEIIAPLAPMPATKSIEAPIAPAPVVQAPHVLPRVVQPRAESVKPESRGNSMDKTNTTIPKASPKEKTAASVLLSKPEGVIAPPVLLAKPEETMATPALQAKPEEKTDAPIVIPKVADDTKSAPRPAGTNDQPPVTE